MIVALFEIVTWRPFAGLFSFHAASADREDLVVVERKNAW